MRQPGINTKTLISHTFDASQNMTWKLFKRLTKSDNILQSLSPLAYISMIGLAPFRIDNNGRDVQTSSYSLAAGVAHFFFFVLCFFLALNEGDSIISYFFQSSITRLGDVALSLSGIIAMVTIFSSVFFRRNVLLKVMRNSFVIDDIFLSLGLKLDYAKVMIYSCVTSLSLLLFNTVYLTVSYMLLRSAEIRPSFVVFTTFAMPHLNISVMVFKFLCISHLTRTRFRMLNEVLQDILNSLIEERDAIELSPMHTVLYIGRKTKPRPHVPSVVGPSSTPHTRCSITSVVRQNPECALKKISHVHNLLCDVCCKIEDYFTYPMLAIIAISFLFIIFDNFYILEAIIIPSRVDKFEADEFFTFFFSQKLWYVVTILLIVEGSAKTIRESNKTAAIVHKILNISDDTEVQDRLLRLSLQLSHRRVVFTAAGLFNLDRSLIFTISGAATTYLIILIQFRSTPSNWDRSNVSSAAAGFTSR